MKTGFIAFAIAAAAPLAMALPFPQAAPGGFFPPPPPSMNGTQPGSHGHYGGGQNAGPGSWLPQPGNGQQPGVPTPGPTPIPTPPPMVPFPPPSASTPPAVPQPPPAAPTEPIVAPTPTPVARK
ncbi:hypothetical protein FPANT_5933 [Fusarium pseudoanthophilum]|uniref:Uncharacterized protein n=1 Tax=Fusarium pseudoanthophilum TaxID=48495 RepID=A0A8H5LEQ7_9HYPO|nr:hypothetical protein FPANT_5933 [Fusarium pseudoanthophilum]